ncbi:MAG: serine hydrolase [Cyanobacteria bacterium J06632_3]
MPAKFFIPHQPLQTQLDDILEATWQAFPALAQNQISLTWIAYEPPYRVNTGGGLSPEEFWTYQPQGASYRGVELMNPDSMVHLFYAVAMQVWLEQGMSQPSAEIDRAMTDMLICGSHDAASFLVDVLTGTTSGPSLPSGPDETWSYQRNLVNRYFASLGWPELRSVNVNQKTWCDRPYGREIDFLGDALENRNQLTTEATAKLLHSIVGGVSVSPERSQFMMDLLAKSSTEEQFPQPLTYLSAEGKVWSRSAITTEVGHSLAYVESPDIHPYLLVIFTTPSQLPNTFKGTAVAPADDMQNESLISFVSERIFKAAQQNFERSGD